MVTPKLDPEYRERLQERRAELSYKIENGVKPKELEWIEEELEEIEKAIFFHTEFLHLPAKDYGK